MTQLWKLTNEQHRTLGRTQWGEGVTHTAPGTGPLCSSGWLHAYRSPELAVLMDPIHASYLPGGHLWETEGEVGVDDGTKVGCTRLTTIRIVPTPEITTEARIRFAILAAGTVCSDPAWLAWAERWLDGSDRSAKSASTAWVSAETTRAAAAWAAWAAAWAAWAAAGAWRSAKAAAWRSAKAAADLGVPLDLAALAHQAIEEERG